MRRALINVGIIASIALANVTLYANNKDFVRKLSAQVSQYTCPNIDITLNKNLGALLKNKKLLTDICDKSGDKSACISSPLSLENEALGLMNIAINPSHDKCYMTEEDQGQLKFYFKKYLK